MRTARLALLALALGACTKDGSGGPVEVKFDRDNCAACTMVISDREFVTEVRTPAGETKKFDDLGCAMGWLEKQPFANDPKVAIWVAGPNGSWTDARTARFAAGKATPMGFGFGPSPGGTLDLEAVRQQLKTPKDKRTP